MHLLLIGYKPGLCKKLSLQAPLKIKIYNPLKDIFQRNPIVLQLSSATHLCNIYTIKKPNDMRNIIKGG